MCFQLDKVLSDMSLRNVWHVRRASTPTALEAAVTMPRHRPLSHVRVPVIVRRTLAVLVLLSAAAGASDAQATTVSSSGVVVVRRPEITRADIDSMAARAEQAGRTEEAAALRARLRDGDFFQGDRLLLTIEGGEKVFSDTVTVAAGQTITLEGYPDISLRGVLRSELQGHLTRELGRYLRSPVVTTRPLLRLTLLGGVARPGFYLVSTDAAVTDLIMMAGGPSNRANLEKTVIRRADVEVWTAPDLQSAMRQGTTVDQLGLHNGDVVNVGERRQRSVTQIAQIVGIAVSAVGLIVTLAAAR